MLLPQEMQLFLHSDSFYMHGWATDITGLNTLNFDLFFNSHCIARATNMLLYNLSTLAQSSFLVEIFFYFKENV